MSTISATELLSLTVNETYTAAEVPAAGGQTVVYDEFNEVQTLNASSTPPGTKAFAKEYTGSQSLDLTAIARDLGANLDLSGLKLQAMLLKNESTTNWMYVADTGANTYQMNSGNALAIPPGGRQLVFFDDQLADVDATHKIITCQIAAGQKFDLVMVFG